MDLADPAACQACGRPLPPQQGRGRRRNYCNATCRSTARRQRQAARDSRATGPGDGQTRPAGPGYVKENLTGAERHGNLDVVVRFGISPATMRIAGATRRLSGALDSGSRLQAMAAAQDLSAAANEALQETVDLARAAGHSWREIGDVLGTTRQAAFQRFGHPVDPRTGAPMRTHVPPGAADHAAAVLACIADGRWEEARQDFNDRMSQALDADRLASAWARMASLVGSYEGMGEPLTHAAPDHVMVEIPLRFEAGEATGRVVFDSDGKVAGLWLRPAGS